MWHPRERLSTHCVLSDHWDREDLRAVTKAVKEFARARRTLNDAAPTGTEALDDTFFVLLKADPTLLPAEKVAPSHLLNRTVIQELAGLSSTRRLRRHTVGDRVQAAMACVELAPVLEGIFERQSILRDRADDLDDLLASLASLHRDADDARERLDGELGEDPDEGDFATARDAADSLAELNDKIDELDAALGAEIAELTDALELQAAVIRADLGAGAGVDEVAERADERVAVSRVWGIEPGDLSRLPADQQVALARRLDTPFMHAIADLFGRIENFALSAPAEQIEDAWDEIYDLELGGNLSRLAPSEFLQLAEPAFESTFLTRLAEHELLQYAVRGTDDAGRGGIVMCIDGSGSMAGSRIVFANALMLVLLHQARRQQRPMTVIHFGGPGAYRMIEFTSPEDFAPQRLLDAAERYFGAGTDFETPMRVAADVLRAEFGATGAVKADVVFATDNECWVSEEAMTDYLAEMHVMGARTWGVLVGPLSAGRGALDAMSEGRVFTVENLTSGRDVSQLLRNAF